jgi:hypothetical protein
MNTQELQEIASEGSPEDIPRLVEELTRYCRVTEIGRRLQQARGKRDAALELYESLSREAEALDEQLQAELNALAVGE